MPLLLTLTSTALLLLLLVYIPVSLGTVTSVGELSVLEGRSVSVPCHYGPEYSGYVKYWCSGRVREICTSLARTDAPPPAPGEEQRVTIFDDPVQQVFTVTMRDLKEGDSGWYWCGVEVGGIWSVDVAASLHINVVHVTTVGELSVLEGRSVSVPCHYGPEYSGYVKYWCSGRVHKICTSLARTDAPPPAPGEEQRVTIFDDPVQQVFTVTMRDLKEGDSGWYWCGVEVGGIWSVDVAASLHINVVHGMSVVNSRLSGEEGSSVTVECLYSERYRETEKRWCRSGDWSSCVGVAWPGGPSPSSPPSPRRAAAAAVLLTDEPRAGRLSVSLRGLRMRDAGWYWCSAGEQQVAVHLEVTPRETTKLLQQNERGPSPAAAAVPGDRGQGSESEPRDEESPLSLPLKCRKPDPEQQRLDILNKTSDAAVGASDPNHSFGRQVAVELGLITNPAIQTEVKRIIMNALFEAQDADRQYASGPSHPPYPY